MSAVLLGYEVGTGAQVSVPTQHLAVTGMTQQSGKTTTLEGLVARSGLRAIAFVTKRHEGSFTTGHQIAPYFRERADWQFVASVLEATLRERLKFERSWIMRACKGAQTLADVHENVREQMTKAKGLAADVYLTLDHYLEIVTPQIAGLAHSEKLVLQRGLNVMDLTDYSTELQALVIRSVLEWVYEREQNTLVIIPEAWEFIPQNRGSPVKLAAEQLIRKGGAAKNFMWLDSQDIAGVHKDVLRQVGVWILGVQREANEVKRALTHIPGNIRKPKADDIMELERGQFFACFGKSVVKTYVQPAWMPPGEAIAVAKGTSHVLTRAPKRIAKSKEEQVTPREAEALRSENAQQKRSIETLTRELSELKRRLAAMPDAPPPQPTGQGRPTERAQPAPDRDIPLHPDDFDSIYAEVRRRALADPVVLKVLAEKPELEILVRRKVVEIDGQSLKGRVARLIAAGFFDEGVTQGQTRSELVRTGPDINTGSLSKLFAELQRDGFFTLESGNRYRAVPDMKVNVRKAA